jgi:heme-degrading monooxygenase HmoA
MTHAVFFDVLPRQGFAEAYFGMAGGLKPIVENSPGFMSVERFENLEKPGWYLSFSQWADEAALSAWRCQQDHHQAQVCGRKLVLEDYRLRVGSSISRLKDGAFSSKVLVAAIVGGYDSVLSDAKALTANFGKAPRMFKGVIDKKRGIALVDLSFTDALAMDISSNANEMAATKLFQIERDYGMFDRAQAPGTFA